MRWKTTAVLFFPYNIYGNHGPIGHARGSFIWLNATFSLFKLSCNKSTCLVKDVFILVKFLTIYEHFPKTRNDMYSIFQKGKSYK